MRILVATGEPSGDLHGAHVFTALQHRLPGVEIEAIGGAQLQRAGATIRASIDELGAMGLVEIVGSVPTHYRLLRSLRRDFKARRYDLIIPIDYPGFHLHLAESARAAGIPVLWYIAPQLWAWRPGRAARLARAVDRLAVILPFESAFFGNAGVTASYVGHPLLDGVSRPDRDSAPVSPGNPGWSTRPCCASRIATRGDSSPLAGVPCGGRAAPRQQRLRHGAGGRNHSWRVPGR